MTKNYKAVLKSSLVMLVLFAVAGSGVAQAQECFVYQRRSDQGSRRGQNRGDGKHPIGGAGPMTGFGTAAHWPGSRNQHYAEHRRSPIQRTTMVMWS